MSHIVDAKIICSLLEKAARWNHESLTGLIQIDLRLWRIQGGVHEMYFEVVNLCF